ncbi:hypothetical protein [Aquimarina mytili]|uniref:Uncharacterized protein n=1 Tax=Aquimarina mytili TaxID=874423 RepID=A0A937DBR5_9FLAO|nr:hypothetical protein [Aquimarina mytili]MBL0684116.1 hypothetical protein [Aquimarina mytili]
MDSIVEVLNSIKQRPAMYIGRDSISCLKAFLDGWYFRNPTGVVDTDVMNKFQDWTEKKYSTKSSKSWSDILLYNSQDESKALELFFKDFDEFIDNHKLDG